MSNMIEYTVTIVSHPQTDFYPWKDVDDVTISKFSDLSEAIRWWDSQTCRTPGCTGGIEVTEFDFDGNCVRDGWLLHVREGGLVYLNPQIISS